MSKNTPQWEDSIVGSIGRDTSYTNSPEKITNEYGLTPKEVAEGLNGLQEGTFDIRILSKRYENEKKNGGQDFEDICNHTDYKVFKMRELYNIKLLLDGPEARTAIDRSHTIIDYGCGNGKVLEFLIKRYGSDIKKKEVKLVDISPSSLYKAKTVVPECDFALMGDFLTDQIPTSSNQNISLSLGGGFGNMTVEQLQQFRNMLGGSGETLILGVFHDISDEDPEGEAKDTISKYRGEVQEKQIWNCLRALGFTDEDIKNCVFDANWSSRDKYGNRQVEVGFIPQNTIIKGEHKFENGQKYTLLRSLRATEEYIRFILKTRRKGEFADMIQHKVKTRYMTHYIIALTGQPRRKNDFWTRSAPYFKTLSSTLPIALIPIIIALFRLVHGYTDMYVTQNKWKYDEKLLDNFQLNKKLFAGEGYKIKKDILNEVEYNNIVSRMSYNSLLGSDTTNAFIHNNKGYGYILDSENHIIWYDLESKKIADYTTYTNIQTRYKKIFEEIN